MNTLPSKKQTDRPSLPLTTSQKGIRKTWRTVKLMPLALLMLLTSLVSGCASNSMPPQPSSVNVDSSLMVKPNYTERLVKLLSE